MNRIAIVAAAAVVVGASWNFLRWMDGRRGRVGKPTVKAVESWENEGGALRTAPNQVGAETSQVPR